jgi:hypothetical protein
MRVAMIGSGYVGLVSEACFADFGHQITCVDKDAAKIATNRCTLPRAPSHRRPHGSSNNRWIEWRSCFGTLASFSMISVRSSAAIAFSEREFDLRPSTAHNVGKRTAGAAGVCPPKRPVSRAPRKS